MIEALIWHIKVDGLTDPDSMKGTAGDPMHALLFGARQNLSLSRAMAASFPFNARTLLAWL